LVHELIRDQPNTTMELLNIITRHASGEEVVEAVFVVGDGKTVPSSSREAPSKATNKGTKKGTKSSKKGQKWHPGRVAIATSSNDNDKEVDGSDDEYVAATERNFKLQARQPKHYFKKPLEAACPNLKVS
jgi:hypothetical protein